MAKLTLCKHRFSRFMTVVRESELETARKRARKPLTHQRCASDGIAAKEARRKGPAPGKDSQCEFRSTRRRRLLIDDDAHTNVRDSDQ